MTLLSRQANICVTVNGIRQEIPANTDVAQLLTILKITPEQVAVEVNLALLDMRQYQSIYLKEGDQVEMIHFVGGGEMFCDELLTVGGITFRSRLIVGTGKYRSFEETKKAVEASGADCITVAVRRVNILDRAQENLLDYLDPKVYKFLPNTAGCYTAEEACRTARLARASGISDMVKLEVIGDPKTLFPDNEALLTATRELVKEGFIVFPYMNDDPIMAKKLQDAGAAVVMPLAAPIGSGLGIRNPYNLRIILESVEIPVIVDAGVGTASDAAIAMEMGCHGVLMNTAIAAAKNPVQMAEAMHYGIRAGRLAYLAGRMPKRLYAQASSPTEGMIE